MRAYFDSGFLFKLCHRRSPTTPICADCGLHLGISSAVAHGDSLGRSRTGGRVAGIESFTPCASHRWSELTTCMTVSPFAKFCAVAAVITQDHSCARPPGCVKLRRMRGQRPSLFAGVLSARESPTVFSARVFSPKPRRGLRPFPQAQLRRQRWSH